MENKMKKLIAILAVLALTAPCLASSVDLTLEADGTTVTIGYENAQGSVPVGVSLLVTVDGNAYVNASGDVNEGGDDMHEVYIDWAYSNTTASLDANGEDTSGAAHPLAIVNGPGAFTLGSGGIDENFALCMGELAGTPGASGTLAVINFTVADGDANICLSLTDDANRGGIIDADGNAMTVNLPTPACVELGGGTPPCIGDVDGDGYVYTTDIGALVTLLETKGLPYLILPGDPLWKDEADVDDDGYIYTTDIGALVTQLEGYGLPYLYVCP
jgi:hypothetical protein